MKSQIQPAIVLVKPRNPLNIGAAARAMANFGLTRLRVVDPYEPVWRETTSAVGAESLVKQAKYFRTLGQAIEPFNLIIGTSAGKNRNLKTKRIGPDEFIALLNQKRSNTALVFGSEKTGLTNRHLSYCHRVLVIPTQIKQPSMNLAHAVAVSSYLTTRSISGKSHRNSSPSSKVSMKQLDLLVQQARNAVSEARLFPEWDLNTTEVRFREAFMRWPLNNKDVRLLHRLFRWILNREYKRIAGAAPRGQ